MSFGWFFSCSSPADPPPDPALDGNLLLMGGGNFLLMDGTNLRLG